MIRVDENAFVLNGTVTVEVDGRTFESATFELIAQIDGSTTYGWLKGPTKMSRAVMTGRRITILFGGDCWPIRVAWASRAFDGELIMFVGNNPLFTHDLIAAASARDTSTAGAGQ